MSRLNPLERRLERFLREPPSVRNAAGVIVVTTTLVVVGAGILISVLDREEYPDVWVGMWWHCRPSRRSGTATSLRPS